MARLSQDEWADMRAEWEASSRQGLTWLTKAGGGRWDVTEEPIRKRRAAENWTKRTDMGAVVQKATAAADRLSAARIARDGRGDEPPASLGGDGEASPDVGLVAPITPADPGARLAGDALSEQMAVDLRTDLIERHRKEWGAVRSLLYRAMREAQKATGFEAAKFAKITSEIVTNIQAGERRSWSLDADLIDYDALTDKQLQDLANGKLPK